MKLRKLMIFFLVIFTLINSTGCLGPSVDIDFKLSWGGISGAIPFKDNNMGATDKKELNVIVMNREDYALEGLEITISLVNPEATITFSPPSDSVVKVGPKGTSEYQPNVFTIFTSGTPPGKYKLKIQGIYDGEVVKSKEFTIDVG